MADTTLELHATASTAPCELRAAFTVGPAHPVLAGHFPGAPLVPGVLLLDAVRAAWERAANAPCDLVAVDDVRWFQPLAPGTAVALQADVRAVERGIAIAGTWSTPAGRVATFALRLAPRA